MKNERLEIDTVGMEIGPSAIDNLVETFNDSGMAAYFYRVGGCIIATVNDTENGEVACLVWNKENEGWDWL